MVRQLCDLDTEQTGEFCIASVSAHAEAYAGVGDLGFELSDGMDPRWLDDVAGMLSAASHTRALQLSRASENQKLCLQPHGT